MLTIYKASAGSGKTFRLVVEYLKLVLHNEYNYKHILAVTFTNKATAEMKERVVSQLYELSTGKQNAYSEILEKELKLSGMELKNRAQSSLKNILHDYSRFSISTIDKFTQRVLKAFNRELGITPGYVLELDNELILQEATDRLIVKVNENKNLLKWLTELGEENIRNSKSFRIKNEILSLGQELFKERFQEFFSNKGQELYSKDTLEAYNKELKKVVSSYEQFLKKRGRLAVETIESQGILITDFAYGLNGVAGYLVKLKNGGFPNLGRRVLDAAEAPEKWYSKTNKKNGDAIRQLAETKLMPLLNGLLDFISKKKPEYITAKKILGNYYTLGILSDLQAEINEIRFEKGVLPLSNSNLLLKKIIGNSDSPFIYEKIGNLYSHYMLDEFQDTSRMQWGNFKPLVHNSLSEGNFNLAVGDVKQSIYRWRNSDWSILSHQVENDFSNFNVQHVTLNQNWRSDPTIINFNNQVFNKLKDLFTQTYLKKVEDEGNGFEPPFQHAFGQVYEDILQTKENPDEKGDGLAQVGFITAENKEGFREKSLENLVEQVKQLQDNGYKASDISILIRNNNDGLPIISKFLEESEKPENKGYNFTIVSNESLFLHSSNSVVFIIMVMMHMVEPEDKVVKATLLNDYLHYILPALKENGNEQIGYLLDDEFEDEFETIFSSKLEQLSKDILNASVDESIIRVCDAFNLFGIQEDIPFIQALIDQAAQLKTKFTNDLSNFVKWWEEKGHKVSVSVNDGADATRLFTIHKSKGLEFTVVLIPFFDWNILWAGNYTPTIWCETKGQPFDMLPLVPVKANKDMGQSYFYKEYFEEVQNTFIDSLNLVYVAFTRAKSVLMVNAPMFDKKSKEVKTVDELLLLATQNLTPDFFTEEASGETQLYQHGKLAKNKTSQPQGKDTLSFNKYHFSDFNTRLKIRANSEEFFTSEDGKSSKNLGSVLHEVMAEIILSPDVKKACNNALKKRLVTTEEHNRILSWLTNLVNTPEVSGWFSGNYQVLTERPLLSGKENLRPDRIMIKGENAIVVDYKTGESENPNHKYQVRKYAKALYNAGFKNVGGYLWYLKTNHLEKVYETSPGS